MTIGAKHLLLTYTGMQHSRDVRTEPMNKLTQILATNDDASHCGGEVEIGHNREGELHFVKFIRIIGYVNVKLWDTYPCD